MGWFGFNNVNDDEYDKNGNPQKTGFEMGRIVESFGTDDLDRVLMLFAPKIFQQINDMHKQINELNKKIDLLIQKS